MVSPWLNAFESLSNGVFVSRAALHIRIDVLDKVVLSKFTNISLLQSTQKNAVSPLSPFSLTSFSCGAVVGRIPRRQQSHPWNAGSQTQVPQSVKNDLCKKTGSPRICLESFYEKRGMGAINPKQIIKPVNSPNSWQLVLGIPKLHRFLPCSPLDTKAAKVQSEAGWVVNISSVPAHIVLTVSGALRMLRKGPRCSKYLTITSHICHLNSFNLAGLMSRSCSCLGSNLIRFGKPTPTYLFGVISAEVQSQVFPSFETNGTETCHFVPCPGLIQQVGA